MADPTPGSTEIIPYGVQMVQVSIVEGILFKGCDPGASWLYRSPRQICVKIRAILRVKLFPARVSGDPAVLVPHSNARLNLVFVPFVCLRDLIPLRRSSFSMYVDTYGAWDRAWSWSSPRLVLLSFA